MLGVFKEICAIELDDGIAFDIANLEIGFIRDEMEYGGLRLKTTATVAGARIRVVIDVGFGDVVEPEAREVELPVLLDFPPPRLRAYPRETVIAEKFQAMVMLGRANSRMKDFYDIWVLSKTYEFAGDALARSIRATFTRRNTEIPAERPDALTPAFASDPAKQRQWTAFVQGIEADAGSLAEIVEDLAAFLMPHAQGARALG
jgi:hypothetical protein